MFINSTHVFMCIGRWRSIHVEIRGQFVAVTFLLPSYGFQKIEFNLSGLETYSKFPQIFLLWSKNNIIMILFLKILCSHRGSKAQTLKGKRNHSFKVLSHNKLSNTAKWSGSSLRDKIHSETQILKGKQSYKEGVISPRWPEQQMQGRATWERESTWNLWRWSTVNPRWMERCATGLATTTGCSVLLYKGAPH